MKAITGQGEYSMKYNHLAVNTDQWFKMSVKQRGNLCQKAYSNDNGLMEEGGEKH